MYEMNPAAARAADVKSSYINDAGKFKGTIVSAEFLDNRANGSENIVIAFKADNGQEANFLLNMVYQGTQKNETNIKILSAILACLRMRTTGEVQQASIEKWNKDTRQKERQTVPAFTALHGKKIGFILQMEIGRDSQDGRARPIIYAPFEYESEKTATEVLGSKPAEMLPRMVERAMERPLIDRRGQAKQPANFNDYNKASQGFHAPAQKASAASIPFDDDVPF